MHVFRYSYGRNGVDKKIFVDQTFPKLASVEASKHNAFKDKY